MKYSFPIILTLLYVERLLKNDKIDNNKENMNI